MSKTDGKPLLTKTGNGCERTDWFDRALTDWGREGKKTQQETRKLDASGDVGDLVQILPMPMATCINSRTVSKYRKLSNKRRGAYLILDKNKQLYRFLSHKKHYSRFYTIF